MTNPDEIIRQSVRYDRETGLFYWIVSRGGMKSGDVAGRINPIGYVQIQINCKNYAAHRLAWFFENGVWPDGCIDHVDNNRANNKISNLRLASVAQNNCNVPMRRNNTSGIKGVGFHKASGKWSAYIADHGRQRYLGLFVSIEDAKSAVEAAREKLHGEFANHG